MRPSRGSISIWGQCESWISQEFMVEASHAILRMRPMSLIRL